MKYQRRPPLYIRHRGGSTGEKAACGENNENQRRHRNGVSAGMAYGGSGVAAKWRKRIA